MKKNHKILISIGIILVVALAGFQVNKSIVANKQQQQLASEKLSAESKEQNYRNAILSIKLKENKYAENEKIFSDLKGYMDSDYLLLYTKALEASIKEPVNYTLVLDNLNKIPLDFKGDLYGDIYQFKIIEKNKQRKTELQQYISIKGYYVENLSEFKGIKINDIDFNIIPLLKNNNIHYKYLNDDVDSGLLNMMAEKVVLVFNRAYVESIIQIKDGSGNPVDSSTILGDLAKQRSIEYKEASDEMTKVMEENSAREAVKKTLRIGMTAAEVLETSWGKPQSVNRTTTANGVSEQWVYGSNRYVYLDNGIVTAIQD